MTYNDLIFMWKLYCCSLCITLFAYSYYKDYIKYMQNKRKAYNLKSMIYEVELSQRELEMLQDIIYFSSYNSLQDILQEKLRGEKVEWFNICIYNIVNSNKCSIY